MNPDPKFFPLILYPIWVSNTIAIGELEGADLARLDLEDKAPLGFGNDPNSTGSAIKASPSFGNDPNSNGPAIEDYQRLLIFIEGLRG